MLHINVMTPKLRSALRCRRFKERNPEANKIWKKNHPQQCQIFSRRTLYGKESINHIIVQRQIQNERCAICEQTFKEEPHLDHNHCTKQLRGVLCRTCNLLLGYCHENTEVLKRAALYLEHWNEIGQGAAQVL